MGCDPLAFQSAIGNPKSSGLAKTFACAVALNAEAQNLALGSAMLDDWLADAVPDGAYDFVSVAFGTNDYYQSVPVRQFQQNARRLVAALFAKQPARPVVLLTPLTWAGLREPNATGFTLDHYREALLPLANEFPGLRLVHGTEMIPDDEQWFVDRVHPNDQGFRLYAERLLPHLRAVSQAWSS